MNLSHIALQAADELESLDLQVGSEDQSAWTPAYKRHVAAIIQRAIEADAQIAQARANSEEQRRQRKAQWQLRRIAVRM